MIQVDSSRFKSIQVDLSQFKPIKLEKQLPGQILSCLDQKGVSYETNFGIPLAFPRHNVPNLKNMCSKESNYVSKLLVAKVGFM